MKGDNSLHRSSFFMVFSFMKKYIASPHPKGSFYSIFCGKIVFHILLKHKFLYPAAISTIHAWQDEWQVLQCHCDW